MCGITGAVLSRPGNNREFLISMRDALRHRGPDDAGTWWSADGLVGLAHRRLAIIDLSPNGHQPMLDNSGELVLTFNGEIYNYQAVRAELEARGHSFRTVTDSEVILEGYRAWGMDCVKHFNGMFAFALYDQQARQLFIARDRAGEKPLYYSRENGRFLFGSELKALMTAPDFTPEIDLNALDYYFAYGYVPGDLCILKSAAKLPQAHALTYSVDTGALRVWRYWDLPEAKPSSAGVDDLAGQLEALLLDSVRLRLIADVPVGVLLSGGLDSSLVTAVAARVSSRTVRTFTITFPGHATYDESAHARLVADFFGTEHTELVAEPAAVDLLNELAVQFDEPLGDSSLVPTYLVSRLIRQHATVALGGDGGDELFGGYPYYSDLQRSSPRAIFRPVRSLIHTAAERAVPIGFRGRNYLMGIGATTSEAIAQNGTFFDEFRRKQLLNLNGSGSSLPPSRWKESLSVRSSTPLRKATETDFRSYLVDDVLMKVDRASMRTSLEVRAPWLDPRIIEFAFGTVPDAFRATSDARKILPRKLGMRLLPPQLDVTRKQGFSLPLQSWFAGPWGDYMGEVLGDADPALFNRGAIDRLIAGQRKGYANTHRLFALTMFELWRRHYNVALPSELGATGA
jgi:asparagine synthase (glutamine-hydrolysing)